MVIPSPDHPTQSAVLLGRAISQLCVHHKYVFPHPGFGSGLRVF
jgi:hypothetical protein